MNSYTQTIEEMARELGTLKATTWLLLRDVRMSLDELYITACSNLTEVQRHKHKAMIDQVDWFMGEVDALKHMVEQGKDDESD